MPASLPESSRRPSLSRLLSLCFGFLIFLAPWLALAPATGAAAQHTYTVTVLTDDYGSGSGLDGVGGNCPANSTGTSCSLRDAITAANGDPGSTIVFTGLSGSIYLTNSVVPGSAGNTLPVIAVDMTINGGGTITIDGRNQSSAGYTQTAPMAVSNGSVTIENLTIANGNGSAKAATGGVQNLAPANLTLSNVVFLDDTAGGSGDGGAIYNTGALLVLNCSFIGDSANHGGAIQNGGTSLTVRNSTFSGNTGYGYGGSIDQLSTTLLTVTNSTFVGNSSPFGAGIYSPGSPTTTGPATVTVLDSTFSGNTGNTTGNGMGYNGPSGDLTLHNNLFVDTEECLSEGGATNCPSTSGTDSSGNFMGASATTTPASLGLLPLGNYGGPTQTLLPLPTSSLICAGSYTLASSDGVTTGGDQRAFPFNTACADPGAVQSNYITVTSTGDDPAGVTSDCPGTGCTLRDAIAAAGAAPGAAGDIDFQTGLGSVTLTSEGPTLGFNVNNASVNVIGPGASSLTVNGPATGGTVLGATGANFVLDGFTIAGGKNTNGGGLYVYGDADVTLLGMAFTGNTATSNGGALYLNSGSVTAIDSTFSNNSAVDGSVLYNNAGSQMTFEYSTFANNTASGTGGINSGTGAPVFMYNGTFSGNTGSGGGIAFHGAPGTLTVENSLLEESTECAVSGGAVCPTTGTNGNVVAPTNTNTGVPALSPLGSYGANTAYSAQTILPEPGSSAICAGSTTYIPSGVTLDERGYANTNTTYTGVTGTCVDAGAVQTSYGTAATFNSTTGYAGTVNEPGTTPPVIAAITENGQTIGGITVPLTVAGFTGGTITPNSNVAVTVAGTGATYSSLEVSGLTPPQTGTVSVSLPVVGTTIIAGGPQSLTISAAGAATTTTEATPVPDPITFSPSDQTVTLAAMVTSTSTVNAGTVAFTIHSGSTTGPVAGTAVNAAVAGGTTGNVAYTIPGGTAIGTYYVVASYSDPGGLATSNDSTQTLTINPIMYTLTIASTTGGTATPASGNSYAAGTAVTITATPNAAYYFTGWTPTTDITNPASASTTITMNANENVTADFATIPTIMVTVTTDTTTGKSGNCPGANCSLRDALAKAASLGAGNITFDPTAFATAQTITLTNGTLTVPVLTTITGPTTGGVTVNGNSASTVFTVNSGTTGVSIASLTIKGGAPNGINNSGTLSVTGSTIAGNTGGGISNAGTLTLVDDTISGNSVTGNGGGIESGSGTLTVADCTISGNTATGNGGGLDLTGGSASLANTIVAANTAATYADVNGTFTNDGGNQAGASASGTSSIAINVAPLANYGGPTATMIPLPGSPAICAGAVGSISAAAQNKDQRGDPDTNTTYAGFTTGPACVDAGAVQTNYSLTFSTEPGPIAPATQIVPNANFQAGVTLEESGAVFTAGSASIPLALTGTGTLSNGTAATSSGTATYSTLQVSAPGTGDTLTANLMLNSGITPTVPAIATVSTAFNVTQFATTVAAINAAVTYNPAAQNVSLSATVTSSGGTVNEGKVTFTVLQGATVIGTATTSGTVTGGQASVNYALPAAQAAGGYTIQAAYSDSGGVYGNGSDNSHTLMIGTATPTITWATPAAIPYGTALSATQLDATATFNGNPVSGTFAYTPAAGTVLGAGSQTLKVTFTPSDTTDYTTATGQVTLTVNAATPTITWATPAPITYGTALSATQLDASSTVAGTFVYTPPAGTVLNAGAGQTLSVTFNPTDTTDYTTAAASVMITVNAAIPTITFSVSNHTYGDPPFTVAATSNSGGAITYSVVSGPASISGSTVTLTGAGTVTLMASQAAAGNYGPGTRTAMFSVAPATVNLTFAAISPQTYGNTPFMVSANSSSTSAVTYSIVSGPATINASTGVVTLTGAGMLTIGASQAATTNYAAATAQTSVAVAKQASQIAVSASAGSATPGQSVTLTATVTPAVVGTPTGTVTFFTGTTPLGSPVPVAGGQAQLVVTTLSSGSNPITATYSGDANFLMSSGSLNGGITVAPLNFTLTASPGSQTGVQGTTFAYLLTVTPTYGTYPGTVTFSASGLPSGATVTFSPSSLAANAGTQNVGMAIATAGSSAALQTPPIGRGLMPVALAFLLLPLAGTRRMRREGRRFSRFLALLLFATAGIAVTAALSGCGSSGFTKQTTSQNYTITVTATSGTVQQISTVTLTLH